MFNYLESSCLIGIFTFKTIHWKQLSCFNINGRLYMLYLNLLK